MLLSIVTATFGRLDYLRAFVESVRLQIPDGMTHEYIIVDGGSRDGTEAWALEQPNTTLIQQGALYGAISAFNAGCAAARGEYVFLGNDDTLVVDGALVRALAHLSDHPRCGAVAFADNRPAPGYNTRDYKVQTIRAVSPQGAPVDVVYAQCGLYRRFLGDLCAWWDMGDPLQNTYGGDAHLSAQIWMRGYTVDAVAGAAVQDRIAQDELRAQNYATEQERGSAYYRKYPNGVKIGSLETPVNPQGEQMRILYLPLFSPGYGRYKRGLYDALAKIGMVYELDYVRQPSRFLRAVKEWQPHLLLTQLHGAHPITPMLLEQARRDAPEMVVVNWNGDYYPDQLTAPDMLELLRHIDLQLTVNTDVFPIYEQHGIKAGYWQISAETVPDVLPAAAVHNVLFMGNAYSPERKQLASVLREIDSSTGIYGFGWDAANGNTFYRFDEGAALYRNCKIAIGDNQHGGRGFVSNRLFEALSNGAFLLHQTVPGLEDLTGITEGVHYVQWDDYADLREKIAYYLKHDRTREKIARAGEQYVHAQHTFDNRVTELFTKLLPMLKPAAPQRIATPFDNLEYEIANAVAWGAPAPEDA